jgi:hypothetical protein
MGTVSRFLVAEGTNLEAGQSIHFWWNNATPITGVFALSVWPFVSFQNNPDIDKKPAHAQIINISQKFVSAIAYEQKEEMEIHFDVRNIGTTRIDYRVYMSVVQ